MSAGSFCAVTITVGTVMRTGADCPKAADGSSAIQRTSRTRTARDVPYGRRSAYAHQLSVQSVSDETSLTKIRLPENGRLGPRLVCRPPCSGAAARTRSRCFGATTSSPSSSRLKIRSPAVAMAALPAWRGSDNHSVFPGRGIDAEVLPAVARGQAEEAVAGDHAVAEAQRHVGVLPHGFRHPLVVLPAHPDGVGRAAVTRHDERLPVQDRRDPRSCCCR